MLVSGARCSLPVAPDVGGFASSIARFDELTVLEKKKETEDFIADVFPIRISSRAGSRKCIANVDLWCGSDLHSPPRHRHGTAVLGSLSAPRSTASYLASRHAIRR
ncbi:hypothetical protein MSG28_010383 [Choristoneura fumiferana]|uniref:Uncharacterized protein n=1 Tax=Choristoneura fumiferana TaxID=7141 RepID=A0ACC0KLC6_CHOFU|nr:hypothetical protein MSG28_010383 [Choristoneura fumiferana]